MREMSNTVMLIDASEEARKAYASKSKQEKRELVEEYIENEEVYELALGGYEGTPEYYDARSGMEDDIEDELEDEPQNRFTREKFDEWMKEGPADKTIIVNGITFLWFDV